MSRYLIGKTGASGPAFGGGFVRLMSRATTGGF